MEMRLQRFLSQAGVTSRRKAETLISEGKVKVNGRVVTELGSKVDPDRDKVFVGGRRLFVEQAIYLLLNKPRGTVTTLSDPQDRPTVMDLIGEVGARVFPIGRLDFNTEGILLFTNDGDLAQALMHPRKEVEKTYRVKVRGVVDGRTLAALSRVELDGAVRHAEVELLSTAESGKNAWIEITVHEGRNRQIHRMAESVGLDVVKLERVRYAGLELGTLPRGKWRRLEGREVEALRRAAGGAKKSLEAVRKRASPRSSRALHRRR
jgi:23S rRNA pseudouridine2605 synthase